MAKFYSQRTCTLNIKKYLPDNYNIIAHTTITTILAKEEYFTETHTIQISSCHRFASICFTNREILLKFYNTEHQLLTNTYVHFEADYHDKIQISMENVPIELPNREVKTFLSEYATPIGKTYYPEITNKNKKFTTGTRVYQCIKLKKDIPRHLYEFGKYLRICYDSQAKSNPTLLDNNKPPSEKIRVPTNHDTPQIEEEIRPRNLTYIQQEIPKQPKTINPNESNKPTQHRSNKSYNN